jgi:hypothetical protein
MTIPNKTIRKIKYDSVVGLSIVIDDDFIAMLDRALDVNSTQKYQIEIRWEQGSINEVRHFTVNEFLKKLGF